MTSTLLYDQGPAASRPAAGAKGRIYNPTDESGVLYKDDGAVWRKVPLGPYDEEVLADSPFLYWPLNEASGAGSAQDLSGSGLTGTYGGTPTLGVAGPIPTVSPNQAMRIADGDDQVSVAHDNRFRMNGSWAIELWFRSRSSTNTGDNPPILWWAQSNSQNVVGGGWCIVGESTRGRLQLARDGKYPGIVTPDHTDWHHYLWSYDEVNTTLYRFRDGVVYGKGAFTHSDTTNSHTFYVSNEPDNPSYYWASDVSHVALYSGFVDPSRARAHYDSRLI